MATTGSVVESDVGILCYISSLPGVRGILKQRYADFIVNEVDLDGNIVHLTSLEAPPEVVTPEDISSGNYMVDDIVLPLPGSSVIYPANDVAQVFEELAKKDSINLKESVHNVKEFSIAGVTGGYRRVFQKPIDFEWELLRYSDSVTPLAETDLDVIAKPKPLVSVEAKCIPNGSADEKPPGFQLTHENHVNVSTNMLEDTSSQSSATKIALKLG